MEEFIVLSRNNSTTRNGSPFVLLKVKNLSRTIDIAVWDVAENEGPKVGMKVMFRNIKDNGGKYSSGSLDMLVEGFPKENDPLYDILPHPIRKEEWDKCFKTLEGHCTDAKLREIIGEYKDKLYNEYKNLPAAAGVHHAFSGGLLNHTYEMLNMLAGIYPTLSIPIKIERCILGIMFHDYGKKFEYNTKDDGSIETTKRMYLFGHIYISANYLNKILTDKGIDTDEKEKTVHCILAHHGQLEYGSPVMPATAEAIIIHHLDNISAKLNSIEYGSDMEYVKALSTHVIKD